MKAFMMQCKVEVIRILRNPYYVFWSLAMPLLFYVVFTKIFHTPVDDQKVWQAHYLMSMTAFSLMGSGIMTLGIRLVEERAQGWSVLMKVTPLPDHSYFIAKMAGQTVIHMISIIVIFVVGAVANGISLSAGQWLSSGLWLLAGSFTFMAVGTLVGTMKKVDTASGVSNVIYMLLAITGGMWMPMEIMPDIIQNIGKWLPAYHFGNGAWEIVRGGSPEWMNIILLYGYLFLFVLLSSYVRRQQEAAV
ncbi:ABC transporter permease [Bacillus sp. FJAT-27251]|uniref:ABC transporter permease n=1 Tax=Bacillus sp. FJAT-27251 TaxID=1684142 RepID=UPI0006A7D978|nr:ABC transporter permease [Bacillus sp. FJAT-27251]